MLSCWIGIAITGAISAILGQIITDAVVRTEIHRRLEEEGGSEESED